MLLPAARPTPGAPAAPGTPFQGALLGPSLCGVRRARVPTPWEGTCRLAGALVRLWAYDRGSAMVLDPWVVLGVSRSAAPAAVKAAYKRLALEWHPDRHAAAGAAAAARAEGRFKEVTAAYEAITSGTARRAAPGFGGGRGGGGAGMGAEARRHHQAHAEWQARQNARWERWQSQAERDAGYAQQRARRVRYEQVHRQQQRQYEEWKNAQRQTEREWQRQRGRAGGGGGQGVHARLLTAGVVMVFVAGPILDFMARRPMSAAMTAAEERSASRRFQTTAEYVQQRRERRMQREQGASEPATGTAAPRAGGGFAASSASGAPP